MKLLLWLALATAALLPPLQAQSQSEMNQQAAAEFQAADRKMNAAYAEAMKPLDDEGRAKLKAAQRAWLVYRDAQAEYEADASRGGSILPMEYSLAKARLTRERTKLLQDN